MERMTSQRKEILNALNELHHASFEDILDFLTKKSSKMSLSTLYRNMEALEKGNFIRKVDVNADKIIYELTILDEHDHFVCVKCHNVIDIFSNKKRKHLDSNGNLIEKTNVTYYGICKNCLSKEKEKL